MAKTLSEYVADVRRITRVLSTTPFSDADIKQFVNEAKDYVSSLVPFAVVHSYYSSVLGKSVFGLPRDLLVVLGCKFYPYVGSHTTANVMPEDTEITVQSSASFSDSGFAVIGEPPVYEIIKYGSKSSNKLMNCERGKFGTEAKQWVYNPQGFVPVRQWERGAKWITLAPQTDVTAYEDNEWLETPDDLRSTKTNPTAFGVRGGLLVFDKPFSVNGFANIVLHCLITPPDLVNNTDTIYGLPESYERIIPVCAGQFLLKALGGEDAMVRYQSLDEEFKLMLAKLRDYVENFLRGAYGSIAVETYRVATQQSRRR